jgi:acyl carrier protein
MSDTLEVVLDIIKKHFKKSDEVTPDTHIVNDLKGDSLDAVEIIMNIEDHYKIDIPEEALVGVRTVSKMAEVVAQYVK